MTSFYYLKIFILRISENIRWNISKASKIIFNVIFSWNLKNHHFLLHSTYFVFNPWVFKNYTLLLKKICQLVELILRRKYNSYLLLLFFSFIYRPNLKLIRSSNHGFEFSVSNFPKISNRAIILVFLSMILLFQHPIQSRFDP